MAVTSALVDSTIRTGSTGTTSTVTGVQFGSAFSGRVVCVFFGSFNVLAPTGATIGGVTAVITGTTTEGIFIASAVVPTGTSGNFVVTFGGSDTVVTDGAAALTGASSATPSATLLVSAASGNINVGAGGGAVAYAVAGSASTWSGATELLAFNADSDTFASFDNSGGALTAHTIGYSTAFAVVAAAFDASGGGGGISASLAATDTPDTVSVSAGVKVSSALAATEAADTISVSSKVKVTSSLAATEGVDTAAVATAVKVTASFAVSEAADVAAFSGTVSNTINASLAATETADTAAISSAITVTGSLTATEVADTAAASAGIVVTGSFGLSEAADTAAISAGVSVTGSLSATEASDTTSISARLTVSAAFATTEAQDTASLVGAVTVTASLAATEGQDVAAINAGSGVTASLAATEAQDAASIAVATTSQPVVQVITGGGGGDAHRKRKERESLRAVIDRVYRELRGVAEVADPQVTEIARQAVETVSNLPVPSKATDYGAALGRMSKSLAAIKQATSDIERLEHAILVQHHAMALARQIETQRKLDEQDEEEVIALLLAS